MNWISMGSFALVVIFILLSYGFLWYYSKYQKVTQAFTIWLIFSVIIALMPIVFNIVVVTLVVESDIDLSTILAEGDFLIVSVAIGSEAMGRIVSSGKAYQVSRIIPMGGCFLLVIFSSLLFAYLSRPPEIPIIIGSSGIRVVREPAESSLSRCLHLLR